MTSARDDRYFQALQVFLLIVILSPMLCCAGCLGLGMFTALFSPPPETAPMQPPTKAPTRTTERKTPPLEP